MNTKYPYFLHVYKAILAHATAYVQGLTYYQSLPSCWLGSTLLYAQVITGKVTPSENNEGLLGVNVVQKGAT